MPENLVEREIEWRNRAFENELHQAGMDWDSYLKIAGTEDREAYDAEQRKTVEEAVRTQFILDAIADAREVTVDNEDLSAQIMAQAQRSRMSPEQYAQQLQQGGNIAEFVADVRRTKTLAKLLEQTTITDESGNVVDLEALRPRRSRRRPRPPTSPPRPPRTPRTTRPRRPDRPDRAPRRRRPTPPGVGRRRRFGARSAAPSANTAPTGTATSEVRVRVDRTQATAGGYRFPGRRPGPHHRSHPPTETDCTRQSYGGHSTREHPRPEPGERARAARRRGDDEPRRLGLRAPAARADHLPGQPGRRRHRQPAGRPDAAAVRRGPQARHPPLHQLARWLGHRGHGDLRHDAVHRLRRRHVRHGAGRLDGAVPAHRRHQRASATPCRTRGS